MKIYDTMQKKNVQFKIRNDRIIKMYVCGPTVYDKPHIGHAKTYVFFDSLAKYLRLKGHTVFYIQNITDVDDKIITRAAEQNRPAEAISREYLRTYLDAMNSLKINSVNIYIPATLLIKKIIMQIRTLIRKGYAYETDDGVYFSVSKFQDYGKLSGQDLEALRAGARVNVNENKRDPKDFVIWKKMKPGEPHWNSPWGDGRPGWHIEDTAITDSFFGEIYDIHGGGADLIFPHHEAEIAIERSITGRKILARYWIHTGMLNIGGEKMSKSLKNYLTIEDVLRDFSPEDIRYSLLNSQFNTQLSFSEELMFESRKNVASISSIYNKLVQRIGAYDHAEEENEIIRLLDGFMQNNLDFRGMFSRLMSLVSEWNKDLDLMTSEDAKKAVSAIRWVDSFSGILPSFRPSGGNDNLIELLLSTRKRLRARKDFEDADEIRSGLRNLGIHIEDQGNDTIWWYSNKGDEGE